MKTAICSGSFDPVTLGHVDIITRASALFDKIYAVVLNNPTKHTTFTLEERMEFLKLATSHLDNVEYDVHGGLLVDYVREKKATAIVRGLRAVSDFDYEFQTALINRKLYGGAETVFLMTQGEYLYLSSSIVKQVAMFGGDISQFIPAPIVDAVTERIRLQQGGMKL